MFKTIIITNDGLVYLFHPVIYKSHYMCINQPSIRLNKVHNISVKVYVCARGVIYLMYWYVYFNLFQDLILRLWPQNQYLHLWSTTFNQFCPRLLSTMDCLWLDTCKQSSTSSDFLFFFFLLAAFCVAVQWEVTGHSNPRLAAGHHPTAFLATLCSLALLSRRPPPAFTSRLRSWLAAMWLWFMINKAPSQWQTERSTCWTNANGP